MTWFLKGSRSDIRMDVSEAGHTSWHGWGAHECAPAGVDTGGADIDFDVLKRINKSKCGWSILSVSDEDDQIDGDDAGLLRRVRESPERSHGMISYSEDGGDASSFVTIATPEAQFKRLRRAFELVLMNRSLQFGCSLEFFGLPTRGGGRLLPTWAEFAHGKPYFFNDVSLWIAVRP